MIMLKITLPQFRQSQNSAFRKGLNALMYIVLLNGILLSCAKSETEEPIDENTGEELALGWIGTENNAEIPNDIQFFRGNLPAKVDLTPYLPPVASQGNFGTCVAWSVGYYTRTGMNAIQQQLSSSQIAAANRQGSPKDLFWAIPAGKKGTKCEGTHFQYALDVLQQRGVATVATVPYQNLGDCSSQPSSSWTAEAANFKIKSYREVALNVTAIKEKLAEDRMVMFAAFVTDAFSRWKGSSVMTSSAVLDGSSRGGHAMTIVGYDDARKAFRIVNSWGKDWGDSGFAWLDYNLMTNSQFTHSLFVAYSDATIKPNPVDPPPSNNGDFDLALPVCNDNDDPNQSDRRYRILDYDVYNIGRKTINSSSRWSTIYMYYNAYDADDYGVLLHQYVTNEFGAAGTNNSYPNGLGEWGNWWYNVSLRSGNSLGQAIFGQLNLRWGYRTPLLNGYYYLVVITDPFEAIDEGIEDNNLYFMTTTSGDPLFFRNGVSNGLTSDGAPEIRVNQAKQYSPVNARHPNAYTPEEIRKWVKQQQANGSLAAKAKAFDRSVHSAPK
jgi:Papain family cysteine protease